MPHTEKRPFPLLALVLALAASGVAPAQEGAPAPPGAPAPAPAAAPTKPSSQDAAATPSAPRAPGRVVEDSVNPYTFSPKDPEGGGAEMLRALFETLGEDAIEWYQHVLTLSNPFFEGRAPGSRGSELTHDYVEFWMKKIGLDPAFPTDPGSKNWTTHRQVFALPGTAAKIDSVEVAVDGAALERGTDYQAMGATGAGRVDAPLTFVGYGIEEGRDGYTSFDEKADLAGRIAVMLRYEPLDDEGRSKWAPRRFSEHASMARKLEAVTARNPAGIVLVNPPGAVDGRTGLESVDSSAFGTRVTVPFVQWSAAKADEILRRADPQGRTLEALRKAADDGSVKTLNLRDEVKVSVETVVSDGGTPASNVGGVIRGRGSLANEWVILGAHLDHVGYGLFGAQRGNRGKLHPGADDNASGTAAILVLARRLHAWAASDSAPADMRSVLVLAFDAEESGLQGSRHYTREPTLELPAINAMVNLDMVGRLRNDELTVSGVGTADGFLDRLKPVFESSGLVIHADKSGRGPSDHASFYAAGVPVLFVFTGSHGEYHKPGDHGYTVNPAGAVKVIDLTETILRSLVTEPAKLVYRDSDRSEGQDRGYARVRFGVQPGVVDDGDVGVKVENVSANTSADEAGIKTGDILLAWNGTALEGASGLMEQLRNHKPGDKVMVRLRRGQETQEVEVTLKESQQRRE